MNLFSADRTLQFTPSELDVLTRPIVGSGGHQNFLNTLIPRISLDGGTLTIDDDELQKAYHYAYAYGGGGYQGRFKVLLAAAHRAGWQSSQKATDG